MKWWRRLRRKRNIKVYQGQVKVNWLEDPLYPNLNTVYNALQVYNNTYTSQLMYFGTPVPQPGPAPEPELAAAPIVGWRFWRLRPPGPVTLLGLPRPQPYQPTPVREEHRPVRLVAFNEGYGEWEPGVTEAVHRAGYFPAHLHQDKPSPAWGCQCGFWAFRESPFDQDFAARELCGIFKTAPSLVYGEVEMWGRVIKHAEGWRGQFARPLRLYYHDRGLDVWAEPLSERYGVPVERVPRPAWIDRAWDQLNEEKEERLRQEVLKRMNQQMPGYLP